MMLGIRKERLIFGVFLLILIIAIELVLHHWHLPAWPVFMVMIFFFETHMDKTKAHKIIMGGLVGIACYVATVKFVELTAPSLGIAAARLAFVCTVVYAIVAFGEVLPAIFNNYAFMFYLVSGLAARADQPAPLLWAGLVVVGGIVVVMGILGIRLIMARISQPQTATEGH